MSTLVVLLAGFSIIATIVIGILGCLLSRCRNKTSYDTVMGEKIEVDKEEYGLLVVDGGGEACDCNTGVAGMTWTILEMLVAGVLTIMVIIMITRGIMKTVTLLQEKKEKRLLKKQEQLEETREQIRLEERNKLEAIEAL